MGLYYVSINTGSDSNKGSESDPFKTIGHASNVCKPGDTILIHPGIYRERITPNKSGYKKLPITYKSMVKHGTIVRGSIPWKGDFEKNGIIEGSLDQTLFTDKSHKNGSNPFLIHLSVTPYGREGLPESKIKSIGPEKSDPNMIYCLGQVFVDDEMFKQCPYKHEMEKTIKSWFYDSKVNKLYINGASLDQEIEITNQRRLLAPHKRGLKNIIIDGFIFERCGNQYPNKFWSRENNQQAGAVGTRCGKYWTIKNNVIRYANGIGIDWGNEGRYKEDLEYGNNGKAFGSYGNKIIDNIICDNGAAGTAAYYANKFEFFGNTVKRNNNLYFSGKQRWESAGLKIHHPKNSIISNNIIDDNYCHGIWSDQGSGKDSYFQNNIILNNKGNGIEFEIGKNSSGKVINNIFNNNEYGIRFSDSGGALIANNLFIKSRLADIKTLMYKREKDKWDSLNVEIYYNTFLKSEQFLHLTPNKNKIGFLSSRYLNFNTYFMNPDEKKFQMKYSWKKIKNLNFNEWKEITQNDLGGNIPKDSDDYYSNFISNNKNISIRYESNKLFIIGDEYLVNYFKEHQIKKSFQNNFNFESPDYYGKPWNLDYRLSIPFNIKKSDLQKNELTLEV